MVSVLRLLAGVTLSTGLGCRGGEPRVDTTSAHAPNEPAPPTTSPRAESATRGILDVAAGGHSTCVLLSPKTVRCAGAVSAQEWGQPQDFAFPSDLVEITVEHRRLCGRTSDAHVDCWIDADDAPDGKAGARTIPGVVGATLLADGCVALREGGARCGFGGRTTPPLLGEGQHFVALAAANDQVVGLDADGHVHTFLDNGRPGAALTQGRVTRLIAGDRACARTEDGAIHCVGAAAPVRLPKGFDPLIAHARGFCGTDEHGVPRCTDASGKLVDTTPVATEGVGTLRHIVAGKAHVCALGERALVCWGRTNEGQLGAPPQHATEKVIPLGIAGVSRLLIGQGTCVLADRTIRCLDERVEGGWGDAEALEPGVELVAGDAEMWGEHGGSARSFGIAHGIENGIRVYGLRGKPPTRVVGDYRFGCMLLADGRVGCLDGMQLEVDVDADPRPPKIIAGMTGTRELSASAHGVCALDGGGDVRCAGALQADSDMPMPRLAGDKAEVWFAGASDIAVVDATACALVGTEVRCKTVVETVKRPQPKGYVVMALEAPNAVPTEIRERTIEWLAGATDLLGGKGWLCATMTPTRIRCAATRGNRFDPAGLATHELVLPSAPASIAVGESHACALLDGGKPHCWGDVHGLGTKAHEPPADVTSRFLGKRDE